MQLHCPICRAATSRESHPEFPFCSERCKLLDLGNWAAERYVVSEPALDLDEDQAAADISGSPHEPE